LSVHTDISSKHYGATVTEHAREGRSDTGEWIELGAEPCFRLGGITKSPEEQFLTDRYVHVHMPEGSIGKEGPSAGTAILSAFSVSLFTGKKVNPDIGEFPLNQWTS